MIGTADPMVIVGVLACDATHGRVDFKPVDVAIAGGMIEAVTPHGSTPPVGRIIDGRNRLLVPGYVNGHQHSHELFFRGRSEKLALEQWMTSVRPMRPLDLSAQDVYLRTLAVAAEALRTGTTTICDDVGLDIVRRPDHLEAVVQAYDDSGIRAFIGPTLFDIPFARAVPFAEEELPPAVLATIDALFADGPPASSALAAFGAFARARAIEAGRVRAIAAPSAAQRCTPAFLREVRALASDLALPVMIHCLETRLQAVGARLARGMSTVRWLDEIGFLAPATTMIHGVWLDQTDIAILARTGATVQHNPMSNLKLGSGVAPIRALLDAGVNVSLGSDGCGSIEALSLQPSVAAAALLSGLRGTPDSWVSAREAFRIATTGGAVALGLEREIGRIAPGHRADLVLYRLDRAPFMPLNDPLRQLVFGEYGANVATVIVDGRLVFDQGRLLTIDEDRLFADLADTHARLMPGIVQAEADAAAMAPAMRRILCRCAAVPLPDVYAARLAEYDSPPNPGLSP